MLLELVEVIAIKGRSISNSKITFRINQRKIYQAIVAEIVKTKIEEPK